MLIVPTMTNDTMRISDAAKAVGLPDSTIRTACNVGTIRTRWLGSLRVVRLRDVIAWTQNRPSRGRPRRTH